jgi:biotin synthase-like enzyme
MKCPRCKNSLLQKSETGTRVRTKGPLVFTKSGACRAQCYWCGQSVTIPLELRKAEKFVLGPNRVV